MVYSVRLDKRQTTDRQTTEKCVPIDGIACHARRDFAQKTLVLCLCRISQWIFNYSYPISLRLYHFPFTYYASSYTVYPGNDVFMAKIIGGIVA